MEQALEAASSAVAALGYAGEKLDVIAKSGHKRYAHLSCVYTFCDACYSGLGHGLHDMCMVRHARSARVPASSCNFRPKLAFWVCCSVTIPDTVCKTGPGPCVCMSQDSCLAAWHAAMTAREGRGACKEHVVALQREGIRSHNKS